MTETLNLKSVRILPCPFCGKKPEVKITSGGTGLVTIRCMYPDCGVVVASTGKGIDGAAFHWNERIIECQD